MKLTPDLVPQPKGLTMDEINQKNLDVLLTLAEQIIHDMPDKWKSAEIEKRVKRMKKDCTEVCDRRFEKYNSLRIGDMFNAHLRGTDMILQLMFAVNDTNKQIILETASRLYTEELRAYETTN